VKNIKRKSGKRTKETKLMRAAAFIGETEIQLFFEDGQSDGEAEDPPAGEARDPPEAEAEAEL